MSKLTDEEKLFISSLYNSGIVNQEEIAELFGRSQPTVSRAIKDISYKINEIAYKGKIYLIEQKLNQLQSNSPKLLNSGEK